MSLLAGLGMLWAFALAYVGWIHVLAAKERRNRRADGVARIAVRAWPPHDPESLTLRHDLGLMRRWLFGFVTDRPRALPLTAAIIAGGGAIFILLDPLMDKPLLWPRAEGGGALSWLPEIVRIVVAGVIGLSAFANILWVFFAAPATLSWERLVLRPDGRLGLEGCAMPDINPARATFISLSIPSAHGAPAQGVTLEQDGLRFAFDYLGTPSGNMIDPVPSVPPGWWHIALEGEVDRVDAFLLGHYGPGSVAYARLTPMPDGDS